MTDTKRVFLVILAHYLVAFAACLAFVFSQAVPPELVAPYVASYRFWRGVLLFAHYMPALQISGLLVGYALAFKSHADEQVDRWSGLLIDYLKGAFVLCIVCLTAYFVMAEGVSPYLRTKQQSAVNRCADYREFVAVAKASLEANDPGSAEIRLEAALQIWPKSAEATKLLDRCQYLRAQASGGETADAKKPGAAPGKDGGTAEGQGAEPSAGKGSEAKAASKQPAVAEPLAAEDKGITALEALDRSAAATAKHDYFNAHYYAMLAWRLARDTDPNKALALRKAAEAWNHVSEGTDKFTEQGEISRYQTKREGYEAIQNGDYLKAYYVLLAEYDKEKASKTKKIDPDVERFLEVARTGLLESFFFIDETTNIRLFESARDVFFVNRRSDDTLDAVFIRGMTFMRTAGKDVAYLRDVEIARLGRDGKTVWRIAVPYAKMFPFEREGQSRPELILHAVDRNRAGGDVLPEVLEGEIPAQERSILLLDMPYRDLDLVVAANRGVSGMTLIDMFRFSKTAEKYGFSGALYQREIINRIAEPFLILIISIYALILGWKYRLGKNVFFRAWWALAIPLFPIITLFVIETVRYLARLCVVAFVGLAPGNALVPTIAFLTVCFVLVSVAFFAQRSD
jgi:hypothetical protein